MTDAQSTAPPSPLILDIRVHGVSNTPPAEMLESEPDAIERVDGDALGSFWARKDKAVNGDGITSTHAFSWGAQTRTGAAPTPAGTPPLTAGQTSTGQQAGGTGTTTVDRR